MHNAKLEWHYQSIYYLPKLHANPNNRKDEIKLCIRLFDVTEGKLRLLSVRPVMNNKAI